MGLIVDTCIWIDAERMKRNVGETVRLIFGKTGQVDLAISALTSVELADGVSHACDESKRLLRGRFLADLQFALPVFSMTAEIAVEAGLLNGQLKARGVTMGLADLLIGVTALHYERAVLTRNVRHFQALPGLKVVEL